ncbi:BspA family leucine-rich repeat surface protein, partial [Fructobacillus pseudoficulneus]
MKSVVLFQRDRENKFTRKVGSTWLMFSLTTCFISGMIIEGGQDVNAATGQSVSVDNSSLGQTLESGVNGTASWSFDSETGTLTFGAGQLSEPIYRMSGITSDSITKIVFSNGISFPYDSNNLMANLHNLTSISGLNQVDISNTRVMWAMFLGDSKLTDLSGVENWDMSNIVDIGGFFQGTGIQNIDLSKWNTSNMTSMWGAFAHTNVRTLTSIQNWDVSKVQVMDHMFDGTADLLNIDLSNWKIQSVHVMNDLFANSGVKQIDGLNNWNVSTVTNANELFLNTYNLSSLDIHSWNLDNATTNGLFTNIGNGDTFILNVGANRFSNSFNDMGPYVLQAVDTSIGGTIADPKGQYFSGTSLQKRYDDGFNSEEVYVFSNIVVFKATATSSLKTEAQKIKQSIINDNTLSDSDKNNQEKAVDDALSQATASVNAS